MKLVIIVLIRGVVVDENVSLLEHRPMANHPRLKQILQHKTYHWPTEFQNLPRASPVVVEKSNEKEQK